MKREDEKFTHQFLQPADSSNEVNSALNNTTSQAGGEGEVDSLCAARQTNRNTTMKKAIKTPVILGLLLTLAGGIEVRAEDKPAAPAVTKPAPSKKPVQTQLNGKVVAVDKYSRSITLQVENLTYVLQVTDSTRVSKSGKEQNLTDVVVGQELSANVLLTERPDGRIEVALLSVDLPEVAEAQGPKHGRGRGHGKGHDKHGPFHHGPHPPNHDNPRNPSPHGGPGPG